MFKEREKINPDGVWRAQRAIRTSHKEGWTQEELHNLVHVQSDEKTEHAMLAELGGLMTGNPS